MGPTRSLTIAGAVVLLFAGCAPAHHPAGQAAAPPPAPVGAPGEEAADRLAAAIATLVASDAGTARATLTATGLGATVVAEAEATWRDAGWTRTALLREPGVATATVELVVADGAWYLRADGRPWALLPAAEAPGADPLRVRDPGQVLSAVQRATDVRSGAEPGVLVATVPAQVLMGPAAGTRGVPLEVRLADAGRGTESVTAVRGTVPGVPALVVDAVWDPTLPPPIVLPRPADVAVPGG